jgi:hypothetical protein
MFLKTADRFYALRFLRLLTTNWEDTNAFKAGIIDKDGKKLRKATSSDDKKVYNLFHKLVFNVKRLLNKIPFGKSKLASYAAGLYLIKEETNLSEELLGLIIEELFAFDPCDTYLTESNAFLLNEEGNLNVGEYEFTEETLLLKNGDSLEGWGRKLECTLENNSPAGYIYNLPIFNLRDAKTGQTVIVNNTQIIPSNKSTDMDEDMMGTTSVAFKPKPLLRKSKDGKGTYCLKYPHQGANWKMFTVCSETFRKFETGRYKFERWSRYLNLQDENEKALYDYASTNRKKTVVLQCSETGALRAIRKLDKR